MNSQIKNIVKDLKSAREERKTLELKLKEIINMEEVIKIELTETYEYLKDVLESEGLIKKMVLPKVHIATSAPARACEAKANEIIERINLEKESAVEESDKEVPADMEKAVAYSAETLLNVMAYLLMLTALYIIGISF